MMNRGKRRELATCTLATPRDSHRRAEMTDIWMENAS